MVVKFWTSRRIFIIFNNLFNEWLGEFLKIKWVVGVSGVLKNENPVSSCTTNVHSQLFVQSRRTRRSDHLAKHHASLHAAIYTSFARLFDYFWSVFFEFWWVKSGDKQTWLVLENACLGVTFALQFDRTISACPCGEFVEQQVLSKWMCRFDSTVCRLQSVVCGRCMLRQHIKLLRFSEPFLSSWGSRYYEVSCVF